MQTQSWKSQLSCTPHFAVTQDERWQLQLTVIDRQRRFYESNIVQMAEDKH